MNISFNDFLIDEYYQIMCVLVFMTFSEQQQLFVGHVR